MNFNSLTYPYSSQRMVHYARNGMVATSHPLAAQAGLDILKKGGNAIDAAIATAACLTVVEPTSNGIGGDAFAIVWTKGKLHGLNSSGQAPKRISAERLKEKGFDKMPEHGWEPVTVPGAPAAWASLSERFGQLPFEEVLQPAINYAEKGFPIAPSVGFYWDQAIKEFNETLHDGIYEPFFDMFTNNKRAPYIGEMWNSNLHAETLSPSPSQKPNLFIEGNWQR